MLFYFSMNDAFYIAKTLRLAAKARGMTHPNPMVGALLLRKGRIVAEDFHKKPGTPHAEALAIAEAGNRAQGSTLYVNLEPCCHTEKRTPPCTKAIIAAGIKKVVFAMKDPNPKVSGKGTAELQRAGIEVVCGVLEEEAKRLNEAYIKYITTRRPFVILKTAMTLDGKIATPEGQSKWITGEKARRQVHRLRSHADAVITAIGTAKADNPQFTARIRGGKNPIRVLIDPKLDIPLDAHILKTPPPTIVVTAVNNAKASRLSNTGIRVIHFSDRLDLNWLMEELGEMGIASVLIEGGGSLNAHALEDGVVDKIMFFVAPIIIGGRESVPAVGGKTFRRLEEAYRIKNIRIKRIGQDFLIEGYL